MRGVKANNKSLNAMWTCFKNRYILKLLAHEKIKSTIIWKEIKL